MSKLSDEDLIRCLTNLKEIASKQNEEIKSLKMQIDNIQHYLQIMGDVNVPKHNG